MHTLAVIRRDVVSKFSGEILSRAAFLLFFFVVARRLGTIEFGDLNLALSVTYMLGLIFLDPGLNLSTIQLLLEQNERRDDIAGAVLSLKLMAFLPLLLSLWAISWLFPRLPSFSVLLLAALYTLFTAILEYFCSVTNAYHRMDIEAKLKIFNRFTIVAGGVVALRFGHVNAVLVAMSAATLFACFLSAYVLRNRLVSVKLRWFPHIMKAALVAGLPIAGTVIVGTIYLKWDLLVLSYFNIGKQQIGWYAGAFKIMEAFSALPSLLGAALFPLILQLRTEDPMAFDRLLQSTTKAVLLFSLPAAAAISLFARPIIMLLYGNSYVPGANVLAVLIWCIVPIFLYFYHMFVNIAAGHAKHNLLAGTLALLAGLTANVLLVPRVGYIGAAWSALIANSTFAIVATWKVCTSFRRASIPRMLLKVFAAAGLMLVAAIYAPVPLAVQFGLGLGVFFIALIAVGALGKNDMSLLVRVLQARVHPQAQESTVS